MGPRLWAEVPFHREGQRRTLPTAKESGGVPALSSSAFRLPRLRNLDPSRLQPAAEARLSTEPQLRHLFSAG